MTFNYAALAASTIKTLAQFGGPVTRRAYTLGTYDPATGGAGPTYADTTRTGVLLDFGAGQTTERGNLIQGADKRLLLDATGALSLQDHIIAQGVEYTLVSIGEVNPAGTRVLYDVHLKT